MYMQHAYTILARGIVCFFFFVISLFVSVADDASTSLHNNNNIMDVRMLYSYMYTLYAYYNIRSVSVVLKITIRDQTTAKLQEKKNTSCRRKHSISKTIAHITFDVGTIRLLVFPLDDWRTNISTDVNYLFFRRIVQFMQ